ncbi:MAG: tetratricopeptide repeat protein [Acidobacteriota bacterium]
MPLYLLGLGALVVAHCLAANDRWAELVAQAKRLSREGRFQEAERVLLTAQREAEQHEERDARIPATLDNLAGVVAAMGRYDEAERLYRRAITFWEQRRATEHLEFARTLNNLAVVCAKQQRYSIAERLYRQSLDLRIKIFGPGSPEAAEVRTNLGNLYTALEDYSKALVQLEEALGVWKKAPGHRYDEAAALNNLGNARHRMGQHAEAERLLGAAIQIWREMLHPDDPTLAEAMTNLAKVQVSLGRYADAEALFKESLAMATARFGSGHPIEASIRRAYADLLRRARRKNEAKRMLEEAVKIENASQQASSFRHTVDVADPTARQRK